MNKPQRLVKQKARLTRQKRAVHSLLLAKGPLSVLDISKATRIKLHALKVVLWSLITQGHAVRHRGNPETYTARRRE